MIILFLLILGLTFGSFVNALVWRLRQQDLIANSPDVLSSLRKRESNQKQSRSDAATTTNDKRQTTNASDDLSILRGRSMCPNCHHTLAAKDLVPVFSWLFLRGKCRYCRALISYQYPVVELLTAIIFGLSYRFWPYGFDMLGAIQLLVWLVCVVGFVALTVYDIRWQELPDKIVWPLVAISFIETIYLSLTPHNLTTMLWSLAAVAVISGLFWLLYEVSKGRWIGFGDVKLGIVLGLLAGTPLRALMVIFFASLLGTLASMPMLMKTKQKAKLRIPFGPFLIGGLIIVYFYGEFIIHWYTHFFY